MVSSCPEAERTEGSIVHGPKGPSPAFTWRFFEYGNQIGYVCSFFVFVATVTNPARGPVETFPSWLQISCHLRLISTRKLFGLAVRLRKMSYSKVPKMFYSVLLYKVFMTVLIIE